MQPAQRIYVYCRKWRNKGDKGNEANAISIDCLLPKPAAIKYTVRGVIYVSRGATTMKAE